MNKITPQQFIAVFPQPFLELEKDEPSFKYISDLVVKDAALSAKVLRIVNSSFFRRGKETDSIQRALARLGIMNFYTIVLVSCLKDSVGGDKQAQELLWDHTEYVAAMCAEIAKRTGLASSEYAYMAGLFHDCSLPVLIERQEDYARVLEMEATTGGSILQYEEANLDTYHSIVSYMFAKSWGLPSEIVEAIKFHHTDNLDTYKDSESRKLGAILILADHMSTSHHAAVGSDSFPNEPYWPQLLDQICDELGLDEDHLEDYWLYGQEMVG